MAEGSQTLAVAGASIAAVIIALCLMRLIRTDDARARKLYRVVFSALAALLAPTPALVAAGHGMLPIPFVASLPVLASNMTSITELELHWLGLLGIGTRHGTGQMMFFTLPSLVVFMLMLCVPWSLPRRGRAMAMDRSGR